MSTYRWGGHEFSVHDYDPTTDWPDVSGVYVFAKRGGVDRTRTSTGKSNGLGTLIRGGNGVIQEPSSCQSRNVASGGKAGGHSHPYSE